MSPPTRAALELPGRGITLSLLDFGGTGSPVLLCHATGYCAALWQPIAARLREAYRVYAYDARGHGESSKPEPRDPYRWSAFAADLQAVGEYLLGSRGGARGGAPIYAIGHSFGGTIALAAAARQPDCFARVALLDPVLRAPAPLGEWPPRAPAGALGPAATAARRRQRFASRDAVRARYARREPFSAWDPGVFELYVQAGFEAQPDGSVALRCRGEIEAAIYQANDVDPGADAAGLPLPALLLFAAGGRMSRASAEAVAKRAARMRIEDVDAGHLFPMEIPEWTAERLLAFGRED